MKHFLFAILLLPTFASAQNLVAKQPDGSAWLLDVGTLDVGGRLQNGDRLVSVLVERRDSGGAVHRARQYTTGCYVHADGFTRWGETSQADEWTWSGPLVLDIIATRSCQYAWKLVEPDDGISIEDPMASTGKRIL